MKTKIYKDFHSFISLNREKKYMLIYNTSINASLLPHKPLFYVEFSSGEVDAIVYDRKFNDNYLKIVNENNWKIIDNIDRLPIVYYKGDIKPLYEEGEKFDYDGVEYEILFCKNASINIDDEDHYSYSISDQENNIYQMNESELTKYIIR